MRYLLSVDFEDRADVEAFLEFVKFHASRMKCPEKDVFVRLAAEWKKLSVPLSDDQLRKAAGALEGKVKRKKLVS